MREILFRGKNKETNIWVYGSYDCIDDRGYILFMGRFDSVYFPSSIEVKTETVGQFTGLYDKNRKRIFDGDIVSIKTKNIPTIAEVIWTAYYGVLYEIIEKGDIDFKGIRVSAQDFNVSDYDFYDKYIEIIGNIHDNPELINK